MRTALVVCWSRHHPERVGEVVFAPGDASAPAVVVGRGPRGVDDEEPKATFLRQQPGANLPQPPWSTRGISRRQLRLQWVDGLPEAENVGRCPLVVAGAELDRVKLEPGRILHLKGQLSFLVVERPLQLAASASFPDDDVPRFGGPDRFGIVGESPGAWELRDSLAFAATRPLHVLLLGPSGSGKEAAARMIHALSPRAGKPLIARNAATIPHGLVDAELFGNVRDYPNPGMKMREGLIGAAHEGTLLLDEIAELPEAQQAHLLRVLDEGGEYQRLGDPTTRRSDLRLIGATNRPTSALKHDLLARLPLRIPIPPLSARQEDVPLLLLHLLRQAAAEDPAVHQQFCAGELGGGARIGPEVVHYALGRELEDNVRGLRTLLWRCIRQSRGEWVLLDPELAAAPTPEPLRREPSEITADMLRAALRRHDGVLERVWRELGLKNRHMLRRLLQKHEIDPQAAPETEW
ncbi:MAG: sigma-54-dependent Fis family transcriptional regulator [Myxococcales bacterium]|nr:sigma-54-dependent Fis family transcriptional regulator [Myxococcales bacterium]